MRLATFSYLLVLIFCYTVSFAQVPAAGLALNPPPKQQDFAAEEKTSALTCIRVIGDYSNQILSLTVAGPDRIKFPVAIASRIFAETVHGLTQEVNSARPPAVRLKLLVMINGNQNYLELVYGAEYDAVITLSEWNEAAFSRLLVRAVRGSILTDQQLDGVARAALLRAHASVAVSELKSR